MFEFIYKMLLSFAAIFVFYLPAFPSGDAALQSGGGSALQTPTIQLRWSPGQPEPASWMVLAGNQNGRDIWHSLISLSENGTAISHHLRVFGTVRGNMLLCNTTSGAGLRLLQRFEETGQPYCFKMVIGLENLSGSAFTPLPSDKLVLELGPGMGQAATGSSSGSSTENTFAEPVASIDGSVTTVKEGTARSRDLRWNSPGIDWAGLQDRYFALLILPADHSSLPFTRTILKFNTPGQGSPEPALDYPLLSFYLPVVPLAHGAQNRWEFLVFSGPKSGSVLASAPVNLDPLLFSGLWDGCDGSASDS